MARISKGQLEKLQRKFNTDEAIGNLFGISRQAVHQLRAKYNMAPVENKKRERDDEIGRLYAQGVPGTRVAKRFKLSVSQAYRIINIHKGKRSRKR